MPEDPYYYISTVIGDIKNFSMALGPASTIPLVIAGFFSGAVADRFNRRYILALSVIIGGGLTAAMGAATAYWQIILIRFLSGISAGFYVPAIMGLLADYFPEKQRTQAIAMIGIGVILGMSANQMTMNIINVIGWRLYYYILGGSWGFFGVLVLIFVKEPERRRYMNCPKFANQQPV